MFDLMKKSMMAGVGLVLKTKDEVEDFAREIVNKGKMSQQEGERFIEDLVRRYEESKTELEDKVEGIVRDVLKKANIATQAEVEQLRAEINDLKVTLQLKSAQKDADA